MSKSVREPCFLSASFVVFIILENYTCSACGSSCVVCSTRCRARSHEGGKKPLCRSSFLLAAGEQIKETWRRSNSPTPPHPHFFPLSLSLPSSVCQQLVLSPKKSSWKWWAFQVLELVVGTYITQSFASVSLHPYISDPALRCGSSLIHWSALGWKVEVQW